MNWFHFAKCSMEVATKFTEFAVIMLIERCFIAVFRVLSLTSLPLFVPHQGQFNLVNLSGSKIRDGNDGEDANKIHLSVQLANPDGALFGGSVRGILIAAEPIQVSLDVYRTSYPDKIVL